MERIKHEILKAREAAHPHQQEAPHATSGVSALASDGARARSTGFGAVRTGRQANPARRAWRRAGSALVGMAVVVALWTLKPDTVAMSTSATFPAEAAPSPPLAVVTPVQPAQPIPPAAVAGATPIAAAQATQSAQVLAAVEAWRQAWSMRDMPTYLDAYSDAFAPPDGMSREDWVASRYRNVGGRKSIDVQLQHLLVMTPSEGRARVSFLQDYNSGSLRELKRPKTLDLVKGADDRWRIVGEWQGDPPPSVAPGRS